MSFGKSVPLSWTQASPSVLLSTQAFCGIRPGLTKGVRRGWECRLGFTAEPSLNVTVHGFPIYREPDSHKQPNEIAALLLLLADRASHRLEIERCFGERRQEQVAPVTN